MVSQTRDPASPLRPPPTPVLIARLRSRSLENNRQGTNGIAVNDMQEERPAYERFLNFRAILWSKFSVMIGRNYNLRANPYPFSSLVPLNNPGPCGKEWQTATET